MRINLFAGPGAGKSTTAAWLFSELKQKHYSVELITEYVKAWAVQNREIKEFHQVLIMAKQMDYEYRFLSNGIKNIVTDSPVLLSAIYAKSYYPHMMMPAHMEGIIAEYEQKHPSLNIFLDRKDKKYITEGRYQTKEQAVAMDNIVRDSLDRLGIEYSVVPYNDRGAILELVEKHIK